MRSLQPSLYDRYSFLLLRLRDVLLFFVAKRYILFLNAFRLLSPEYLDWTSRVRAKRLFYYAARSVPAYRDFISDTDIRSWGDIPCTDKANYIKKYSTEERCVGGKIPDTNVAIDESSGSTGTPYDWVRSIQERKDSHAAVSYFASFCFGEKPLLIINAFSMGAWATE